LALQIAVRTALGSTPVRRARSSTTSPSAGGRGAGGAHLLAYYKVPSMRDKILKNS
jgi:hypothetical protein